MWISTGWVTRRDTVARLAGNGIAFSAGDQHRGQGDCRRKIEVEARRQDDFGTRLSEFDRSMATWMRSTCQKGKRGLGLMVEIHGPFRGSAWLQQGNSR